jgi:glycosyltransferase involved in cell wall biosynthesis
MAATDSKVLLVGVEPQSLINFRKDLICELLRVGHSVTVVSNSPTIQQRAALENLGVTIAEVVFWRGGINPIRDLTTAFSLWKVFRANKPNHVIAYTAKPVIYGALAARWAGKIRSSAMITGLGYSFVEGSELKRRIARLAAITLYKTALRRCHSVIFQNPDDLEMFRTLGLLQMDAKIGIVNGSGVDVDQFAPAPIPGTPVFLMIARLLADKGVREYVVAAKRIREALPGARTLLVGGFDPSPNAVSPDEVATWISGGLEHLGQLDDVRPAISSASVVVLPSYREGTPRSVLEGMAMGRAIITTDVPGCRETVTNGENGLLVPARNAEALFDAMKRLAADPGLVARMGRRSREIACGKYEGRAVARSVMNLADLA